MAMQEKQSEILENSSDQRRFSNNRKPGLSISVISFILLIFAMSVIGTYYLYNQSRMQRMQSIEQLESIADLKATQVRIMVT
jgi:hypothetical protein